MRVERARTVPLRTAVWMALGSAAFVGAFFAGVLVARARPEPGGGTAEPLSFAGTLRRGGQAMSGRQSLTFTLRKGEVACSAGPVEVEVDGEGHFTAPIPLGAPGGCPAGFFDGSDVVLEVGVAGETFTGPVNPVPYAKYAEQVGTPDCPAGYERDTTGGNANFVVCKRYSKGKAMDELVRVGYGRAAFWIDRYEASVWTWFDDDPSNTPWGQGAGNYPDGFHENGQWSTTPPAYGWSVMGVSPARYITWFQANEACSASGKRLPTGTEWILAARGTPDGPGCNVNYANGDGPRSSSEGFNCTSYWGAQEMIGNLWEWTDEWYAGVAGPFPDDPSYPYNQKPWPQSSYNSDAVWHVASDVRTDGSGLRTVGLPSVAVRGGDWTNGQSAGVFSMILEYAPSAAHSKIGFRCVVR